VLTLETEVLFFRNGVDKWRRRQQFAAKNENA